MVKLSSASAAERDWAAEVFSNWRAAHAYPIKTFQQTLRSKLEQQQADGAIVAQRLKRAPSIIAKLTRFPGMQLARMQDIGGIRAVVPSLSRVTRLEQQYRTAAFKHVLTNSKDYISEPKDDGYRGIHLIFRYKNHQAPAYDGLSVELQIRTHLQHAWATAVETMGTFLGQALKAGQGDEEWRSFFTAASAGLACMERSAPVPGFERMREVQVFGAVAEAEHRLRVLDRLRGFTIAANHITQYPGSGVYHLIILDSSKQTVEIKPYPLTRLEEANHEYARIEKLAHDGKPTEAVLVAAGPVEGLRKAYPNYFLDTQVFSRHVRRMIAKTKMYKRFKERRRDLKGQRLLFD